MRIRIGAVALAAAALAVAAPAQAQTLKIRLNSAPTIQIPHDIKPKNKLNKGDWIYFKDLLLNRVPQFGKKAKQPIAYDVGTITYTNASTRKLECKVIFSGIGTITYGGVVIDRKDGTNVFPITGGTGGFKGVKGTVTFGTGKTTPNTFDVTIPGHKIDITGAGKVA
jgi:hypothetical protein